MTQKKENIQFTKISVSNKERTLYVEKTNSRVTPNKDKSSLNSLAPEDFDQPVHPDFLAELQLFVPHWILRIGLPGFAGKITAEYLKKKKALTDEDLKGFYVSGFSISAKGLINIIGGCKNEDGQVTSMTAPLFSLDLDNSKYAYAKEVTVLVENCFEHATDYIQNGKFGEGAQSTLDLKTDKMEA